jgi:E3 ubiquitin-protein ligase SHPRH
LETLLTAEVEAKALIKDLNAALERLNSQSKCNSVEQATSSDDTKGKGKEKESPSDTRNGEDDDAVKRSGVANGLREAELLLHKATFLMGDVYHTLGAKYSKEEEEAYAKAELIRRKLLKGESRTPV